MQSGVFSFSKAIDTFCPIGPWIVTKDEIPDPHAPGHGAAGQRGRPAEGQHRRMVLSRSRTWWPTTRRRATAPGDIITTGTISGVAAVQPNPFDFYLQPGDLVEAEIESIGMLRNHVVSWEEGRGTPVPSGDSLYRD